MILDPASTVVDIGIPPVNAFSLLAFIEEIMIQG